MPSFNPNIPRATDFISDSQQDLLDNNRDLDESFGINHKRFSDPSASNGKHTFIEMLNRAVIPPGLTSSTGTLYTKKVNGRSQLFYTPDNSGNEYQITNTSQPHFNTYGAQLEGWVFLGKNIILQYGSMIHLGGVDGVSTSYPVMFDADAYSIQITQVTKDGGNYNATIDAHNNVGFHAKTTLSSNLLAVNWFAIGPFTGS